MEIMQIGLFKKNASVKEKSSLRKPSVYPHKGYHLYTAWIEYSQNGRGYQTSVLFSHGMQPVCDIHGNELKGELELTASQAQVHGRRIVDQILCGEIKITEQ